MWSSIHKKWTFFYEATLGSSRDPLVDLFWNVYCLTSATRAEVPETQHGVPDGGASRPDGIDELFVASFFTELTRRALDPGEPDTVYDVCCAHRHIANHLADLAHGKRPTTMPEEVKLAIPTRLSGTQSASSDMTSSLTRRGRISSPGQKDETDYPFVEGEVEVVVRRWVEDALVFSALQESAFLLELLSMVAKNVFDCSPTLWTALGNTKYVDSKSVVDGVNRIPEEVLKVFELIQDTRWKDCVASTCGAAFGMPAYESGQGGCHRFAVKLLESTLFSKRALEENRWSQSMTVYACLEKLKESEARDEAIADLRPDDVDSPCDGAEDGRSSSGASNDNHKRKKKKNKKKNKKKKEGKGGTSDIHKGGPQDNEILPLPLLLRSFVLTNLDNFPFMMSFSHLVREMAVADHASATADSSVCEEGGARSILSDDDGDVGDDVEGEDTDPPEGVPAGRYDGPIGAFRNAPTIAALLSALQRARALVNGGNGGGEAIQWLKGLHNVLGDVMSVAVGEQGSTSTNDDSYLFTGCYEGTASWSPIFFIDSANLSMLVAYSVEPPIDRSMYAAAHAALVVLEQCEQIKVDPACAERVGRYVRKELDRTCEDVFRRDLFELLAARFEVG